MANLKRNSKGEIVYASGLRVKQSTLYKPNQTELFIISRTKLNDFLSCPKCFYLDRVIGLVSPSTPGWTLNALVDTLLKKADEIPQNKRRETLLANKDKALLSRQLVTLKDDVPIKEKPNSFILKEVQKDKKALKDSTFQNGNHKICLLEDKQ